MRIARKCVDLAQESKLHGRNDIDRQGRHGVYGFILGAQVDCGRYEDTADGGHEWREDVHTVTVKWLDEFGPGEMFEGEWHVLEVDEADVIGVGEGTYANPYNDDWYSRIGIPEVFFSTDATRKLDEADALEEELDWMDWADSLRPIG